MVLAVGVPLLALLAVLQSSVLSYLRFLDGRPDLVLLAVGHDEQDVGLACLRGTGLIRGEAG